MSTNGKILVIGGGISGISAAADAAELGCDVILVEKEPYLGGRVVRMNQYFPKLCPPTCGMEINIRRVRQNPRIKVYTFSEVETISGSPGDYTVTIRVNPRYVTGKQPVSQAHIDAVATEIPNPFNYNMDTTKALFIPHDAAYPMMHVLKKDALTAEEGEKLKAAEPAGAIDLDMKEDRVEEKVGAVIIATGWRPYDVTKLENLGAGKLANVITNVMMERLASRNGPTEGKLLRPSDGKEVANVAFVQCAGSRDENHLPYCSAVCCMGSLKQARYVREKVADAKVTIFYIDIRTIGRFEKFYYDLLEDQNVRFVKGKVAKITEDPATKNPIVEVEEVLPGDKKREQFDMVVLATGVVPATADSPVPGVSLVYDNDGFLVDQPNGAGIFGAGCVKRPLDVSRSVKDATAAVMKAIQIVRR
ncbi:MAG: CoB--CoM heterodisulfide reductase iron-sulfur subunit A family protein [Candidatus Abyssobacteria bacterium SURF_17]|jgi:quinone-modifying oxidoreductase subunit QmoA|uniref:CoB--CoM heterodisulfide reductase iron-sulfur subunit A family protein n=1 Tax=Candidatus Abyssobacteria bacterium SURF_17 TaxID=2093361 RepID=A0A419EYA7_9BACT|nr:MAG: CoB--CoM heterodisulfide reductase iron-sulfur subunit A family protein [Candidatus Abyssubacteria bacterium SURF_17]